MLRRGRGTNVLRKFEPMKPAPPVTRNLMLPLPDFLIRKESFDLERVEGWRFSCWGAPGKWARFSPGLRAVRGGDGLRPATLDLSARKRCAARFVMLARRSSSTRRRSPTSIGPSATRPWPPASTATPWPCSAKSAAAFARRSCTTPPISSSTVSLASLPGGRRDRAARRLWPLELAGERALLERRAGALLRTAWVYSPGRRRSLPRSAARART